MFLSCNENEAVGTNRQTDKDRNKEGKSGGFRTHTRQKKVTKLEGRERDGNGERKCVTEKTGTITGRESSVSAIEQLEQGERLLITSSFYTL